MLEGPVLGMRESRGVGVRIGIGAGLSGWAGGGGVRWPGEGGRGRGSTALHMYRRKKKLRFTASLRDACR